MAASPAPEKVNLALEGGGVLGIAEVGALAALMDSGRYEIANVAGTSAGSLVAANVAIKLSSDRLKQVVSSLDYNQFQRPASWLGRIPVVGTVALWAAWAITGIGGRYKQDYITQVVDQQLVPAGCATWGDLEQQVAAGRALPLRVITFTPNTGERVVFPDDYGPKFGLDYRTQPISFAVRSSCSILTFFVPPQLTDAWGRRWYFTDGGATDSYPWDVANSMDPSRRTIGLCLDKPPAYEKIPPLFRGPRLLLRQMLTAGSAAMDRIRMRPEVVASTVVIDTLGISPQDFSLRPDQIQSLYQSGYQAAQAWIAKDVGRTGASGPSLAA